MRTHVGNLIYGVTLQVNVGDRLAKKIIQCIAAFSFKKTLESEFRVGWTN